MRVVRIVDIDSLGAVDQTYDLRAMGAMGVIVQGHRQRGQQLTVSVERQSGQWVPHVTSSTLSDGTISARDRFGLPLLGRQARLQLTGNGAFVSQLTLVFVDEPIAPFGRVLVGEDALTILANDVLDLPVAGSAGVWTGVQMMIQATKQFSLRMTVQGVMSSIDRGQILSSSAATGSVMLTRVVQVGGSFSFRVKNVSASTLTGVALTWGWLGDVVGAVDALGIFTEGS